MRIYDYPDGTIDIKHCGKSFKVTEFDKLRTVNEANIVNNKRLGAVLKFAKANQAERAHKQERSRSEKSFSRSAQKREFKVNPRFAEPVKPEI